jgi:hypothetical protein
MEVEVHIRRRIRVEIPNTLLQVGRKLARYNQEAAEYAMHVAREQLLADDWYEGRTFGGTPYRNHPALGWINWNIKDRKEGDV